MKKKRSLSLFRLIFFAIFTLIGCGGSDGILGSSADEDLAPTLGRENTQLQNQIFFDTNPIDLEITPNSTEPSFAWRATGEKFIVLTIFKEKIDLRGKVIVNPEDAVWTWNTAIGKGREGNVSFSDGFDVKNGETSTTVTPLNCDQVYYIAIWGYNDSYNLIYSSEEYQYVTPPCDN